MPRHKSNVLASPLPLSAKSSKNSIMPIKAQMFPAPVNGLTTQTGLTDRQNIICRFPPPFQNFGEKIKIITKAILCEPPKKVIHYLKKCNSIAMFIKEHLIKIK